MECRLWALPQQGFRLGLTEERQGSEVRLFSQGSVGDLGGLKRLVGPCAKSVWPDSQRMDIQFGSICSKTFQPRIGWGWRIRAPTLWILN